MTVAELIRGAFRVLGVLAAEETPSAAEETDAFTTLNDMLDSWAGERLILFATQRSTYTLTPGLNPHSIGMDAGATFADVRPNRIDRASIVPATSPGTEIPLRILSDAEWQNTQGKTSLGTPAWLWVDGTWTVTDNPIVSLWLNPVPSAADGLVLYTWQQLAQFPSTAYTLTFPPGYLRAIRYNLAKELAPEYGVSLSAEAVAIAEESKSTLKRLNERKYYLRCDPAVLQGGPFGLVSGDG